MVSEDWGLELPKVVHLGSWGWGCSKLYIWGWGWGWGGWGWVLLGSMGLVVSPGCQKLYGLVRKPLATLHRAAGEPLRQAPNYGGTHIVAENRSNI